MSQVAAPIKPRFLALLIDFALILIYVGVLAGATLSFYHFIIGDVPTFSVNIAHAIGFLSLTLPITAYFILCELSRYSGSLGKRITGIKVSSFDGNPLTAKQVIIRNIIKFLPWEYAHTLIYILVLVPGSTSSSLLLFALIIANIIPLIYVFFVLLRKDHRGPHDLVAGTIVINS